MHFIIIILEINDNDHVPIPLFKILEHVKALSRCRLFPFLFLNVKFYADLISFDLFNNINLV